MTDDADARRAEGHAAHSGAAPAKADGGDEALIADLREAFELDGDPRRPAGPDRPGAELPSSDAAGRAFGTPSLPPGSRLDDFEILGELGRGGMGIVYRARQISLGREVALKVLPTYARHGRVAVQRFRAEAQAAARLHHTNVVSIYAQGEYQGQFYYAMELVDGVSLDVVIRSRPDLLSSPGSRGSSSAGAVADGPDGPRPATCDRSAKRSAAPNNGGAAWRWTRDDYRHVAALTAEVADALECAHRCGVIHRDVKPHNLLLGKNDRLHLTDFGLARLTDEPHLTVSGEIMGTPAYLSPEQVRGDARRIDHRSDVYSLGVTLYEMITRQKPFDGETREQIITGIRTAEPVAPRRLDAHIPIDLETICLRAMAKDPARRHPSAALLAEDLRRFAEGWPILSRRTSRLEKAVKWMRRHKALSAALVATAGVLVLAAGLAWSVYAGRQAQAQQLLQDAYEQLAYFDYHDPERVAAKLDRAEALGVDPCELRRVRALASMGATEWSDAIHHLQAVLEDDPTDMRAWYLLAWAHRENGEYAPARATFEEAERRGPPATADGWFFRGLAIHLDEPSTAIESYRRANALRAREHEFYPQAVLHLARARNQQIYATRSPDGLQEADADLRQLIEHGHYGAYPHYLLSIGHRLAAEIYSGSTGTRVDLAEEHYAQALRWARLGQQVDPANDRPITAEAECLESRGDYAAAIQARSRAIEVAARDSSRCEGYHYRWRLYYWTGQLQAAKEDAARHAECMPHSRCYAHVYPALIHAELGEMRTALAHARALADEASDSAQAVLWSASCLRLLGRPAEAAALLAERAGAVDCAAELVPPQSAEWVRALYAYCQGEGDRDTLTVLAAQADAPWRLWGEAHFHAAALRLAEGDRDAALAGFFEAYRSFDGELRYTYHAKLIHKKMQENPTWPPWIAISWNDLWDTSDSQSAGRVVAAARSGAGEDSCKR